MTVLALPRIACLHTAQSNIAVFDAALDALGAARVTLHHFVRADLLDAAERAGGLTPTIIAQTVDQLHNLARGAEAVLLTCSTLGPAADAAARAIPVIRVDAALASDAVKGGGTVVVLCAVATTVQPTRLLFEAAARATGADVSVQFVPGAWDAFKAGKRDRYLAMIAEAADAAFGAGATQVALAQASMTGAAAFVTADRVPLSSPVAGLAAAIAAVS